MDPKKRFLHPGPFKENSGLKKTLYFVYGPTTYTKFVSTFFFQIIIKQTLNFQVEES